MRVKMEEKKCNTYHSVHFPNDAIKIMFHSVIKYSNNGTKHLFHSAPFHPILLCSIPIRAQGSQGGTWISDSIGRLCGGKCMVTLGFSLFYDVLCVCVREFPSTEKIY